MSVPLIARSLSRRQSVVLVAVAFCLALVEFQAGRQSVSAARLNESATDIQGKMVSLSHGEETSKVADHRNVIIRNLATVPFSELYDVLRSASREQLLVWAKDLEKLPRGPRQTAAVTAYYKSLIQVDPAAAIEAVFRAENLPMRDVAIEGLLATAPESTWRDICTMMAQLPFPDRNRPIYGADPFAFWSRVDPVAASQYLESKPLAQMKGGLDTLLRTWGASDPAAATRWMESDPARQTEEGIQALLWGWRNTDPAAAVDFALKNAGRANFAKGINELAYSLVRYQQRDDARALIKGLPAEQAALVVHHIASETTAMFVDGEADYQRPPDEVARWMATLPAGLWEKDMGVVFEGWFRQDEAAARGWLDQLPVGARDAAVAEMSDADFLSEQFLPLALTISNPRLRDKSLRAFLRIPQGEARDEAKQTVTNLPISPLEKQYLLRVIAEENPDED